jgi:hypothetical protein
MGMSVVKILIKEVIKGVTKAGACRSKMIF